MSDKVESILCRAEQLARAGNWTQLATLVEPLANTRAIVSESQFLANTICLSFAYLAAGRFVEAADLAEQELLAGSTSLDLYYLLASAQSKLLEHDAAVATAQKYIALWDDLESHDQKATDISAVELLASRLYTTYGISLKQTGQLEEAEAAFKRAIVLNKTGQSPYLNLVLLYNHLDRIGESRKILESGLANADQTDELKLLKQSCSARPTISACLIVRNEEDLLPDCLASIRDVVDEIIVVDTGSTDNTVAIAREYGALIFHQSWQNNFAKHRNHSLEQASSDWLLVIDADERLSLADPELLRELVSTDDLDVISLNLFNVSGDEQGTISFLPSIRLFRRSLNLKYHGAVHNVLALPDHIEIHRADLRIEHVGYNLDSAEMARKTKRTAVLLEQQLKNNPDDPFALCNYAQLLCGLQGDDRQAHAGKIIELAEHATQLTSPGHPNERAIHLMCLNQLAWTRFYTGDDVGSAHDAQTALALKPNFLDALLLLGHLAAAQDKYEDAIICYQDYLDAQAVYDPTEETENMIIAHLDSRANALHGLALAADRLGREEEARGYRQKLETLEPRSAAHSARGTLGYLIGEHNDNTSSAGERKPAEKNLR